MSNASDDRTGVIGQDEYPTIREQDLAIILADWVRLMTANDELKCVQRRPHEPDALDLTVLVAELSPALHSRSLEVILRELPSTEKWVHLRHRLERMLDQRKTHPLADYPERLLPVF